MAILYSSSRSRSAWRSCSAWRFRSAWRSPSSSSLRALLIKFDDDSLAQSYTDKLGDSIRIKPYSSTFDGTNDKHITRKMLPIIHAWAVTIHKTQGLTLKKAIICLSGCFGYNMEYVALSRLTSSNGLFLWDLDREKK